MQQMLREKSEVRTFVKGSKMGKITAKNAKATKFPSFSARPIIQTYIYHIASNSGSGALKILGKDKEGGGGR